MGGDVVEAGEVKDKSVGMMKAQYFKESGDAVWDKPAGPFARRSFASPFGALRAPCLGDRDRVEFAPLLRANRPTAPARIQGAATLTTATAAAEASVVAASVKNALKLLPAPNSDFYQLVDVLTADDRAIVRRCVPTWRPTSS
jgi:hypothetical protein